MSLIAENWWYLFLYFQDQHRNLLQYSIPSSSTPLASVFGQLEQAMVQFPIEDYSVSQTTLDQVCQSLSIIFQGLKILRPCLFP